MGQDKQENARRGTRKQAPPRKGTNNLLSYRPTELDLKNLRENPPDWVKVWEGLGRHLASGFKLSMGMNQDNGSYYAILREPGDDWRKARAVGVWSISPAKALICIFFYLINVNPDFPEGISVVEEEPVDW